MGLPKAAVNLLLSIASAEAFRGSIATLGRQHVYLTEAELRQAAVDRNICLSQADVQLHRDPGLRQLGYLSDDSLYALLGFSDSSCIDQSDYEAANETLDLNEKETPLHLREAFDVVLDSGTIEHIFEIGQAMRHCLEMTRTGGRIIHLTPSSNAVNHGLYSVSPTLFADFYGASGCEIERLWLCRSSKHIERCQWDVYDCLATDRNWLPLGRLDSGIWFTLAVIRKRVDARAAIPQQSFYLSTWRESDKRSLDANPSSSEPDNTRAGRLLAWTAGRPGLHALAKHAINRWRSTVNALRERRRGRVPFPYIGKF
jgi:SAM-dependent methyltransferase